MTVHFLKSYLSQTSCSMCRELPAEGRLTCEKHLTSARIQFRKWSKKRRQLRICIRCDRSTKTSGCLRCGVHRAEGKQNYDRWISNSANREWKRWYETYTATTKRDIARGDLA